MAVVRHKQIEFRDSLTSCELNSDSPVAPPHCLCGSPVFLQQFWKKCCTWLIPISSQVNPQFLQSSQLQRVQIMKDLFKYGHFHPLSCSSTPSPNPFRLMWQRCPNGALGTPEVKAKLCLLLLLLQMVSLLDRAGTEQDFISPPVLSFCQSLGSRGSSRWAEWSPVYE